MDIFAKPFPHTIIPSFLQNPNSLLQEIQSLPFFLKESDLFTFFQTNDITNSKSKEIQQFKQTLINPEFVAKLEKIFAIKLNSKLDIFASLYQQTHYLLPHDDQLEGRKLAYIFYLTDMKANEGGALCLYDDKPVNIIAKIQPKANTLVIFKVSDKSFHEVEEVFQGNRISLTGWFY